MDFINILTTSEVFDLNLLAKYFAIVDLVNAKHAAAWHNIRFYYDPFQSKLVPIGFDGDTNELPLDMLSIQMADEFREIFLKISNLQICILKILREYLKNLT